MLNLQTTASSKNEQSAIQSATQKKNEGGNGDFLGALLASLNKDTSHTSSNVTNAIKSQETTVQKNIRVIRGHFILLNKRNRTKAAE